MNTVIISLGSNIRPQVNIEEAINLVCSECKLVYRTRLIKTSPQGLVQQPSFLNGAILLHTDKDINSLKAFLLDIESRLGRVRGENKNAPRTIDLDITVFNGEIVDEEFYKYDFVRQAVFEIAAETGYQLTNLELSRLETRQFSRSEQSNG